MAIFKAINIPSIQLCSRKLERMSAISVSYRATALAVRTISTSERILAFQPHAFKGACNSFLAGPILERGNFGLARTYDHGITDDDGVHAGAEKTGQSLSGRIHDRLIFIEARVEQDGNACDLFEFDDQPVIKGVLSFAHGLQSAGAVHMGDGRQQVTFVFANRIDLLHEWIRGGIDKIIRYGAFQNRGSKGAEPFSQFDLLIDEIAHVRASRIGKDTAIAQGASAPLHSALKPPDHIAFRKQAGSGPACFFAVIEAKHLEVDCVRVTISEGPRDFSLTIQQRPDIVVIVRCAPQGMVHHERPRLPQTLVPDEIRSAQRRAVVGGSGLNINLLEGSFAANLAVHHTVHGASPSQAKPARFRAFPQAIQDMKNTGFVHGLQRAGDVFMEFRQRLIRTTVRAEQAFQFCGINLAHSGIAALPLHLVAVGPVSEILEVEFEQPITFQMHQALENTDEAWPSVGRQAHDLELVTITQKAQVLGDCGVKNSERVREINSLQHL